MGASESKQLSSEAPTSGYHVVRVAANSPAHLAGIEPFFDFCVGLDGQALSAGATGGDEDAMGAWKKLEEKEGTQVTLNVWSSKRQELREVTLVPSRSWSTSTSGPSESDAQPSLLGLTLRLCAPHLALSAVWHILDILEESPAESAGLVPFGDYVIGWAGGVLKHEGDFYELVEAHEGRPLRLYVYNSDYDHTREVIIVPNREWGGEGLLGCGVGFGLLHRIPRPQDRPPVLEAPEGSQQQDATLSSQPGQAAGEDDNISQLTESANQSLSNMAIPKSSTDPSLGTRGASQGASARGRKGSGSAQDDDDDDDEEGHTSGVTISMRREEEEDEDEEV
ncbi:unnamed protein product [Parajaminaea phylloscopi]